MKSIQELNPTTEELIALEYNYQTQLTEKLDNIQSDFKQELINEIVLWKINRYAFLDQKTLDLINKIHSNSKIIDLTLTTKVLIELLNTKGIGLPMASTILRFKNPNIYQIIDQRVFRLIYGSELKLKSQANKNINLYFDYLSDLQKTCGLYQIPFSFADRILYEYDKLVNPENIKY